MPELQEKFVDSRPLPAASKQVGIGSESPRPFWVLLFLAAGCALRVWHASGTFLNSDEVMHFAAANQTSWAATYRMSLALSHPPLLIFLLHIWRTLGTSELVLRLPSIAAGMAFCWFTFYWAQKLFSRGIAWIIYSFVLFLPASIELSTEIRQYALLLAFAMCAAYLLERALAEDCPAAMFLSGASLWLAICSHFSAFLFAAALAIYSLWRMLIQHSRARVVAAWITTQLVAISLCAFFYFTQIRHLGKYFGGHSALQGWMSDEYLAHSYYTPGTVNPLIFALGRTIGVFQYAFRQLLVGDLGFVLFVVGVILIFRNPPGSSRVSSRQLGALLLLPFVINCAAAMVRAYPYGGTRHSSFLLPFALAGVSVALNGLLKQKILWGIAVATLIALTCRLTIANKPPYFSSPDERSSNMRAAIGYIRQLPPTEIIFGDFQTNLMLGHYLCDQQPYAPDQRVAGFVSFQCGGHRVVASTTKYVFDANTFCDQLQKAAFRFGLPSGSAVQIAQMGWNTHLLSEIKDSRMVRTPHSFGSELHLFEFTVPQAGPAALPKL